MIRHPISKPPIQKWRESGGLKEQVYFPSSGYADSYYKENRLRHTTQDLYNSDWREQVWDQLHPREGKYRPDFYPRCTPWLSRDERFLLPASQPSQQPERESKAYLSRKWKYWIGGAYQFAYPSNDEHLANVTLTCNWANADSPVHWSIELVVSDAPYPGMHSGSVCKPETYCVTFAWETPFFSPYGQVQKKIDEKGRVFHSEAGGSYVAVKFGERGASVHVLQYVLRFICALLIYGPLHKNVPKEFEPKPRLEYYSNSCWGDRDLVHQFFQKDTAELRNVTSFFSRAYNNPKPQHGERHITSAERHSTINAVDCIFGHFGIVQEPPWVEQDDWVDQLPADLETAQTLDEWQKVECQWATLVSYSTGLKLHQGPWAGPLWERYLV